MEGGLAHVMRQLMGSIPGQGAYNDEDELTELQFAIYLTTSICLVLMAGLMSGLTLGCAAIAVQA